MDNPNGSGTHARKTETPSPALGGAIGPKSKTRRAPRRKAGSELSGAKKFANLFREMRYMPGVLRAGYSDPQADDSTEYAFAEALGRLERLFEHSSASERRGVMKSLAWIAMLSVHGFGIAVEDFDAERVLTEVDSTLDRPPIESVSPDAAQGGCHV